ncbi:beta-agarase [Crateriforma spongiae]|uniref:beta-agarase n=1 Tax=Crateriforma spongiae TaxID=2724528 RepID=UPI001445C6C7|nr:beta-agarase [Crateriforma spongiae]
MPCRPHVRRVFRHQTRPRFSASLFVSLLVAVASSGSPTLSADDPDVEQVVLDLRHADVEKFEAKAFVLDANDVVDQMVAARFEVDAPWPGITIEADQLWGHVDGACDWSGFQQVQLDLVNESEHPASIQLRIDSGPDDNIVSVTHSLDLASRATGTLVFPLKRQAPEHLQGKLFGMRAAPAMIADKAANHVDQIRKLILFMNHPDQPTSVRIGTWRLVGRYHENQWWDPNKNPFPMIDALGQYVHRDWPGKLRSESDLLERRRTEQIELGQHPGPDNWNRFGGFATGPQLKATGRFRVEKFQNRWWLVDPLGKLFWSNGIDCVHGGNATTPIDDREFYFADLPEPESPLAQFYSSASWAPHGYYQDKGRYRTFNFTAANLHRKYGSDWKKTFAAITHQRLRSWGINTIANWSDADIYRRKQTPYVVTVTSGDARIQGSDGYWGKFPDPFDPRFAQQTLKHVQSKQNDIRSEWCIGVFVDNELAWGDETSLAIATVMSPSDQPAKEAFRDDLVAKYESVDKLNAAWQSDYASWQDWMRRTDKPSETHAEADLKAFYSRIAEQYFDVCRDAVKTTSPSTLYLGCRFAWSNDRAVTAAAISCDVIGFNRYAYSVADDSLPQGVDRPAIIGEFHFGALDRGLFHTGLRATENQDARARAYQDYLTGALRHPNYVGAHWFQYGDQAATGRGDGENYQIGFLDVCDSPYPEMVEASRQLSSQMYSLRLDP